MTSSNNLSPAAISLDNGTPVSTDFDDIYFSPIDGIAESQYHFIEGNHLTERFCEDKTGDFTIIETGFGTGLNCLLTAELWQKTASPHRNLHYIATEKHPIPEDNLAAIYQQNNWQSAITEKIINQYPPLITGQYTIQIAANIRLTLLWGDTIAQLNQYPCVADAFFLDGFAPSKNPDMWTTELYECMRTCSNTGTTFATFTAAGHVRRGLLAAGFTVNKTKGFGQKRERLIGYFGNQP